MKSRRSLIVISGVLLVLLVAVAALLYALPTIARHVAIARLQAITKRPVAIDRVEVWLLTGRLTIHGLLKFRPSSSYRWGRSSASAPSPPIHTRARRP